MTQANRSNEAITAVILAGGMSRRLGRNKALEPFEGEPLIQRVIGRMRKVASDVVVVANDDDRVAELDLPPDVHAVVDEFPGKGSLGGIYSGLKAARTEWSIFCACDMPFLNPDLYRLLLSRRDDNDAVVPVVDGRPEPIHAAYSQRCLGPIREKILADRLKISGFFDDVRLDLVSESDVRAVDPDLHSFFNVNTEDDLEKAESIMASESRE